MLPVGAKARANALCKAECELDRDSVSNHLVAIDDSVVQKLVGVRKSLDASAFTNAQPAIEVLFARVELKLVDVDFFHFRG